MSTRRRHKLKYYETYSFIFRSLSAAFNIVGADQKEFYPRFPFIVPQ